MLYICNTWGYNYFMGCLKTLEFIYLFLGGLADLSENGTESNLNRKVWTLMDFTYIYIWWTLLWFPSSGLRHSQKKGFRMVLKLDPRSKDHMSNQGVLRESTLTITQLLVVSLPPENQFEQQLLP